MLLASAKRRGEDETESKVDEKVFLAFQVPGNRWRFTTKVYGHACMKRNPSIAACLPRTCCFMVVLSIVSRILGITCDIFGIFRYQYRQVYPDIISYLISCDISRSKHTFAYRAVYIASYAAVYRDIISISCDVSRYDISKYRIHIRSMGTDLEMSYPVEICLDTQHHFMAREELDGGLLDKTDPYKIPSIVRTFHAERRVLAVDRRTFEVALGCLVQRSTGTGFSLGVRLLIISLLLRQ